jgi:integrase
MPSEIAIFEKVDALWPQNQSRYAAESVSESTRRAYRSDLRHFLNWGASLPSTPDEVIRYLEDHAKSLSIRTLRRRVATLNEAHRLLGISSPADRSEVRRVLRGIARTEGKPAKKAPPLLVEQAKTLVSTLDGSVSGVRDKAMILLGWSLFLRRSEIIGIDYEQLNFMSDRVVVHLGRSKTDQENKGRILALPLLEGPACPVTALNQWLNISGIDSGPIFRRVFKGGNVGSEDHRLTPSSINLILKRRALEAGVSDSQLFSGHSLRRGGITESFASQVPESDIQQVSRHKSIAQLRDYRDDASTLAGEQPSQSFLSQLNDLLSTTPDY